MSVELKSRPALLSDAGRITEIYNQGIEERIATFETEKRTVSEIEEWFAGAYPVTVVEKDGQVVSFARIYPYSSRKCYSGVAEFSVYVHRNYRGLGAGKASMFGLIREAAAQGYWKLVSRVFVENVASRSLLSSIGFREVGIYEKHAMLEDKWKDVIIVEYLFERNSSNST